MPSARVMRIIDTNYLMGNFDSGGWQPPMSFSDDVFGFLEEGELESPVSNISEDTMEDNNNLVMAEEEDEEKQDGKENVSSNQEESDFWETQHQLLQATLCRTSSLESRIRSFTKDATRELRSAGTLCGCGRPMVGGCRNCWMAEVAGRLRDTGFDCAICETKWRNCPEIPSGEHTFLDVIDHHSSSGKKRETRVIIELNFRAEFEMAKANEEYNRLVRRLPEVFVGKVERLQATINIICSAAKRCMKEKKMHMGPWRRRRYMQAKWLGTCNKRTTPVPSTLAMGFSGRLPKPKASMLTVDLLGTVAGFRRTAVEVV